MSFIKPKHKLLLKHPGITVGTGKKLLKRSLRSIAIRHFWDEFDLRVFVKEIVREGGFSQDELKRMRALLDGVSPVVGPSGIPHDTVFFYTRTEEGSKKMCIVRRKNVPHPQKLSQKIRTLHKHSQSALRAVRKLLKRSYSSIAPKQFWEEFEFRRIAHHFALENSFSRAERRQLEVLLDRECVVAAPLGILPQALFFWMHINDGHAQGYVARAERTMDLPQRVDQEIRTFEHEYFKSDGEHILENGIPQFLRLMRYNLGWGLLQHPLNELFTDPVFGKTKAEPQSNAHRYIPHPL